MGSLQANSLNECSPVRYTTLLMQSLPDEHGWICPVLCAATRIQHGRAGWHRRQHGRAGGTITLSQVGAHFRERRISLAERQPFFGGTPRSECYRRYAHECRFSAPIGQVVGDFASTYRPGDFQHL
jgi:hypothetical protein